MFSSPTCWFSSHFMAGPEKSNRDQKKNYFWKAPPAVLASQGSRGVFIVQKRSPRGPRNRSIGVSMTNFGKQTSKKQNKSKETKKGRARPSFLKLRCRCSKICRHPHFLSTHFLITWGCTGKLLKYTETGQIWPKLLIYAEGGKSF